MKLIVAVDCEWGIGYRGDLLARVRADLKNFQRMTTGQVVVLGANTLATFPGGRVLKNRTNIVLSSRPDYRPEGAIVAHSIDELLSLIGAYDKDSVFIIGGASVYRQMLQYCDTAYVTKFDKSFKKDAYFPDLDADPEWECIEVGDKQFSNAETDTEGGLGFRFCEYRRIR